MSGSTGHAECYHAAMVNAPDNIADLRRHLGRALTLIAKMEPDYTLAKQFYDGTRAEQAASRAARAVIEQTKEAPLSFAHIPVDTICNKVELSSIVGTGAAAKRALETWAAANDIEDESIDWIRKAGIFGDYYVVTDPTGFDEDGNFSIEDIDSVGMSPLSTIVVYDKKTGRVAQYGAHFWDAGDDDNPETRAILYYDDFSVKLVAAKKNASDADDFSLDYPADGDEGDAFLDHDGGRMLIEHLAIGSRPYGTPLHRRAYGAQDAITKISANNLVNIEALGLPSRWALVDPNTEVDDDVDDDFGTDGPDTPANKRDGRRDATTGRRTRIVPGAIEYLRGVSETGTYEAAQADPFLSNLDWYVRAMAVATGIPLFEFDLNGEQPSGEARRRAEGRSNRTAASVKRQAAAFFRGIALTVLGLVGAAGEVTVTFNPSETSTDKDGLELVAQKIKAGVPVRQALLEAGYTDTQVAEWYPDGAPAISPDLLTTLASALQSLGQAKTLGAIDNAAIAEMIPEVFRYVEAVESEGLLPGVVTDPATSSIVTNSGSEFKAKADGLGILIRAGADPEQAAEAVETGVLSGLTFPNVPVTVRLPESAAAGLEGDAPTPTAP